MISPKAFLANRKYGPAQIFSNPVDHGREIAACFWFALFVILWLVRTWHWPMVGDATLIRYVVLAMEHHAAPYRQIHDINMPGAYLLDWLTLKLLGPSSAALRIYDCVLLGIIIATMAYITRCTSSAVGFCAGCLFALFHARDGFEEIGQRDLVLAALLVMAMALAIDAARRASTRFIPVLLGVTVGFACTIKPVAIVFLLVTPPLFRNRAPAERWASLRRIAAGICLPVILLLAFLVHSQAVHAFVQTISTYIPYHARLGVPSFRSLLQHLVTPSLAMWMLGLLVAWFLLEGHPFEAQVALLGVGAGALCYVLQLRGYNYHRYPLAAAVLAALAVLLPQVRTSGGVRQIYGIAVAVYCAVLCPLFLRTAVRKPSVTPQGLAQLQSDLEQVPRNATIQCIDSIGGCIGTLVHLGRFQSTGEMYDEFLFHTAMPSILEERKSVFLKHLMQAPPSMVVVTMGLFPESSSGYQKLSNWPAFNQWLGTCYALSDDRFYAESSGYRAIGYRMYQLIPARCASAPRG